MNETREEGIAMLEIGNSTRTGYFLIPALTLFGLLAFVAGPSPAGQSEGEIEQISDAELAARIRARLDSDPEIEAAGIEVEARRGEVWLGGVVGSHRTWERAHRAVGEVKGTTRLRSDLRIRAPELVPRASDDRILADVRSKLDAYPFGPGVEIEIDGGVVTLSGRVGSAEEKKTAALLARSAASVRHVDDRLQVRLPDRR